MGVLGKVFFFLSKGIINGSGMVFSKVGLSWITVCLCKMGIICDPELVSLIVITLGKVLLF